MYELQDKFYLRFADYVFKLIIVYEPFRDILPTLLPISSKICIT
nr:MAG TPA: hypothetical protein [Caudoviricetes sp.]